MSINGAHDIEGLKCIGAIVAAARDAIPSPERVLRVT
jgi:hypothetical protein